MRVIFILFYFVCFHFTCATKLPVVTCPVKEKSSSVIFFGSVCQSHFFLDCSLHSVFVHSLIFVYFCFFFKIKIQIGLCILSIFFYG